IRCGTTPGRMDPHPPAARAKRRARDRPPAAGRPGSHSSHRLFAPRYQARQRLHSRRRVTRVARLRFRAHRLVRHRANRDSHPGLRADRAISLSRPAGAVERLVRVRGSSVLDDHRQKAGGSGGARASGYAAARDTLKRIEAELAKHIGPIASFVIKTAAKKAYTIAALAEIVSGDIVDDKERAAFVRRFSGDKSTPTGDPTRAGNTRQPSGPPTA